MKTYLYNHTNEDSAYIVEDYPWGFRLRTKIRYWIETVDTKTGGDRLVSQTINPKTGLWCKPKKSTYDPVKVMYLNDIGHVHTDKVSYSSALDIIEAFEATHKDFLSAIQLKNLRDLKNLRRIADTRKYTIREEEPILICGI